MSTETNTDDTDPLVASAAPSYPTAPPGSAIQRLFDRLQAAGYRYGGRDGDGGNFQCPAHADHDPSLHLEVGVKASVVATCRACGVSLPGVLAALAAHATPAQLTGGKVLVSAAGSLEGRRVEAGKVDWGTVRVPRTTGSVSHPGLGALIDTWIWTYVTPDGEPVRQVVRANHTNGKAISQRGATRSSTGFLNWRADVQGIPVTPLNWEQFGSWLADAQAARPADGPPLYIVEGEKAADALVEAGLYATTYPGGANGKLPNIEEAQSHFAGFSVFLVWADADEPGFKRAGRVSRLLKDAFPSATVTVLMNRNPRKGDDAADVDLSSDIELLTSRIKNVKEGLALLDDAPAVDQETQNSMNRADAESSDPLANDESIEFKDATLARRIADEFERRGDPVLYSAGLGWLRWTGKQWKPTDPAAIRGKIMDFALDWLRDLAGQRGQKDTHDQVAALLTDSRAERVVKAMQALIRAEATDFDRHPHLLNCQNGVVDLKTGLLQPHDPALRLTKIANQGYRPEARGMSPDWEQAKQALDSDDREYLLDRLGQAITGHTPGDDKIIFNSGSGGNGKSTFLEPVRLCLGDYAGVVPQKLLLANASEHPTELMTLRGLRLALIEELPEGSHLNTQRLKTIVGTEAISGRHLYKDFVTFTPSHALFINTNHEPTVTETDHGTWRRLEKIAFKRKYRAESGTVDETLRQRVKRRKVQEAVLADLVWHAQRYYEAGQIMPRPPAGVVAATQGWRSDSDDLLAFFNDRLEPDLDVAVRMSDVLDAFNERLAEQGGNRAGWGDKLLTARLTTNESLPVPFEKGHSRKFVGLNGIATTKPGSAVAVWRGVRFKKGAR